MNHLRVGLLTLALLGSACGFESSSASFCEGLVDDEVRSLLGDTELETFSVEPLQECVWTSSSAPDQSLTVRIEDVPDGSLFVEHAIEATNASRVQLLDVGEQSVLFVDEAVLGRTGDRVALITATVDVELLVPLLEQTLESLAS